MGDIDFEGVQLVCQVGLDLGKSVVGSHLVFVAVVKDGVELGQSEGVDDVGVETDASVGVSGSSQVLVGVVLGEVFKEVELLGADRDVVDVEEATEWVFEWVKLQQELVELEGGLVASLLGENSNELEDCFEEEHREVVVLGVEDRNVVE